MPCMLQGKLTSDLRLFLGLLYLQSDMAISLQDEGVTRVASYAGVQVRADDCECVLSGV